MSNDTKVIIINGKPQVGKDTFVNICHEINNDVVQISTVDYVKEFAKENMDWDGIKTPKSRKMLSDLKDLLSEWNNSPILTVEKFIEENPGKIIFIHCREPENIEYFVNKYNAITLYIYRKSSEDVEQSNHADENVENYKYSCYINNSGTLKDMIEKCRYFMENVL